MHDLVGHANTAEKAVGFPGEGFIEVGSLITIVVVNGFFDVLPDGIDNQSTGNIPGQMATHPIGDDIKSQSIFKNQGIFIGFAFFALIGYA